MRINATVLILVFLTNVLSVVETKAQVTDTYQTVLIVCGRNPEAVISSQSSFGAPIVALRTPCADAVSSVISTPLSNENRAWDVNVSAVGNQSLLTYTIVESMKIPGPPGPEGPKGNMGDPGSNGARVLWITDNITKGIDSTPGRIVLSAPPNSPPGPYLAYARVAYDLLGQTGEIRCSLNNDPSTEVIGDETGLILTIGNSNFLTQGPLALNAAVTCFAITSESRGANITSAFAVFVPVSQTILP